VLACHNGHRAVLILACVLDSPYVLLLLAVMYMCASLRWVPSHWTDQACAMRFTKLAADSMHCYVARVECLWCGSKQGGRGGGRQHISHFLTGAALV